MKKVACVLAVIGIINILYGIAFKMHHLDDASFLAIWGTMFTELIVLPALAIYMMRNKFNVAYTFGIMSLSQLIAGIFFIIQHWAASFESLCWAWHYFLFLQYSLPILFISMTMAFNRLDQSGFQPENR